MNTKIKIAGIEFKNPVMTASGTFGSGMEYGEFVDLNKLGGVVTKGVANVPWEGNPTPRVAEVYGGMLNAIGLQNPGVDVLIERDIPFLQQYDTRIIVNVCGKTVEDYLEVVEKLGDTAADMLEINVSCPNVKEGAIAFGQKADCLYDITSAIKKKAKQPVIMKLSPNVTDISEMAKAAEAAGADALSMINTITGMKIDIYKRKFVLANKTGGLSGPAVKPVAVRMVYQASKAVKIPIIGMGGISCAEDAIEFLMAGASAVAVGAMNFVNPYLTEEIAKGIESYMEQYHIEKYFFLDSSFPMIKLLTDRGVKQVALRFSELEGLDTIRNMAGKAEWVWVDCFTKVPIDRESFRELKSLGYKLCFVSPELEAQEDKLPLYKQYIKEQGIVFDAICTKSYHIKDWMEG